MNGQLNEAPAVGEGQIKERTMAYTPQSSADPGEPLGGIGPKPKKMDDKTPLPKF